MQLSESSTRPRARLGFHWAALVAFVVLSLTVIQPLDIGMAVAGTGLLIATRWFGPSHSSTPSRVHLAALVAAAFLLLMSATAWSSGSQVAKTAYLLIGPAVLIAIFTTSARVRRHGWRWAITAILLGMLAVVAVLWIVVGEEPDIDVLGLHEAAADALMSGDNPYTGLSVPDTSPLAPDDAVWEGYPYPPSTLLAYAGADLLLGDARWAGVIAIAALLVVVTRPWADVSTAEASALAALSVAILVQPVLGHILSRGWTDPLALPFIAGAAVLWRRRPILAAALLGLAFGTKQYFVLALPLLLLWSDDDRWRRLLVTTGTALASLLPAVVVDAGGAWNTLVTSVLAAPVRSDSIGLAGLGWEVPLWVIGVSVAATMIWMARTNGGSARFLLALAAVLGVGFLLGSQAFFNYWFFIASLGLVAVAGEIPSPSLDSVDTASRRR